jgi:predicted RNase H-like nuclease (RuvC/YqgF family)
VSPDLSQQVEELLESYRVENNELSGQLQEQNRIIMDLEGRLKRTENKYFSTAWKLSSTKREINNPLKKRFPNLRNTITLNQAPLLEK